MKNEYHFQQIDKNSYKPFYIQLSEMIIDYAKNIDLKPGGLLPSENELLSKFDVSRNTIRLAVDRLVKMNFAVKRRGQGTFLKEKKRSAINLDLTQGFEELLNQAGMDVENKLIEKRVLKSPIHWIKGLNTVTSDKTVLIRRLKLASGKILALEDRILPAHVLDRYSDHELEKENINPNLLEKYPDTETSRVKYFFVSQTLNRDGNELLNVSETTTFLQRIGEYYNSVGECFMIGRHIFVSKLINPSYEFEKSDDSWIVKS